ncbi:MAG: septum formation initiator family protein [Bacteroidales bacterium]|jgi:cell division protein FtsB|nr:septum formation initiator family protein [Bacteroidales bacterium]MBR6132282.1 septum formation initiator family protein [Bacteroidales bacterium]MCR5550873.1 septum formation initiator family protein [Bacteroidales bacterium]
MEEKEPRKNRFRFFAVLYGITTVLFLVYFLFLSNNTLKTHRELNRKIDNLENKITHTKNQVGNVHTFDEINSDSVLLEQYAREQLNMHKENEDVFILVHE